MGGACVTGGGCEGVGDAAVNAEVGSSSPPHATATTSMIPEAMPSQTPILLFMFFVMLSLVRGLGSERCTAGVCRRYRASGLSPKCVAAIQVQFGQ